MFGHFWVEIGISNVAGELSVKAHSFARLVPSYTKANFRWLRAEA